MVTNPGETQLVSSLGVSLGGRTVPPAALEMTRGTLKGDATGDGQEGGGAVAGAGCPFSSTLRDMGIGAAPVADAAPAAIEPTWSESAREQVGKLPASVRYVLTRSVEDYARNQGYPLITPDVIAAAKRGKSGVDWSADAASRLENIPDFVRPMARREIERLARERGATLVTAEVMDQAKDLFGQFGH
jgi:hypothetical protein